MIDFIDKLVDKFEQFYYTRIAKPSKYYNEEVLSNITNVLVGDEEVEE